MTEEEFRKKQIAQLKETARILLRPAERLPFPVVVEAMTSYEVLPITTSKHDQQLLKALAVACTATVVQSVKNPIQANRPNEVSTQVECLLQVQLEAGETTVEMPRSGRGGGGYPDRLLWHEELPSYLEVKVSRESNITQGSARNFFYQPTVQSKIQHSARHLLSGFSLREIAEKQWILTAWKIVDLFYLQVKLKPEYNANNLEIYRDDMILMQGDAKGIKSNNIAFV